MKSGRPASRSDCRPGRRRKGRCRRRRHRRYRDAPQGACRYSESQRAPNSGPSSEDVSRGCCVTRSAPSQVSASTAGSGGRRRRHRGRHHPRRPAVLTARGDGGTASVPSPISPVRRRASGLVGAAPWAHGDHGDHQIGLFATIDHSPVAHPQPPQPDAAGQALDIPLRQPVDGTCEPLPHVTPQPAERLLGLRPDLDPVARLSQRAAPAWPLPKGCCGGDRRGPRRPPGAPRQ